MYGFTIKTKLIEKTYFIGSYANAYEGAIDKVIDILSFYTGLYNFDNFLVKDHLPSTRLNPKFYCIPYLDIFRIYEHNKIEGLFYSSHNYNKICTIKVIKVSDLEKTKKISTEFQYFDEWDDILYDIKNESTEI